MTTAAPLVIRGLRASHGEREVLHGVDLDVAPGTICALMGRSGAGKSTVLRTAVALQSFTAGTITLGDIELSPGAVPRESRLRALRRRVGMVFQSHALFEHITALENVTLAPIHALGWSRETAVESAGRLLASLGVEHRADAFPRQLSGGEAQRVAIARALALDPAVLLMDEPTAALDPARRGALAATLRSLASEGRGLLIATHDVEFAQKCADRAAILSDGLIVEEGPVGQVLAAPSSKAARDLLSHHSDF